MRKLIFRFYIFIIIIFYNYWNKLVFKSIKYLKQLIFSWIQFSVYVTFAFTWKWLWYVESKHVIFNYKYSMFRPFRRFNVGNSFSVRYFLYFLFDDRWIMWKMAKENSKSLLLRRRSHPSSVAVKYHFFSFSRYIQFLPEDSITIFNPSTTYITILLLIEFQLSFRAHIVWTSSLHCASYLYEFIDFQFHGYVKSPEIVVKRYTGLLSWTDALTSDSLITLFIFMD